MAKKEIWISSTNSQTSQQQSCAWYDIHILSFAKLLYNDTVRIISIFIFFPIIIFPIIIFSFFLSSKNWDGRQGKAYSVRIFMGNPRQSEVLHWRRLYFLACDVFDFDHIMYLFRNFLCMYGDDWTALRSNLGEMLLLVMFSMGFATSGGFCWAFLGSPLSHVDPFIFLQGKCDWRFGLAYWDGFLCCCYCISSSPLLFVFFRLGRDLSCFLVFFFLFGCRFLIFSISSIWYDTIPLCEKPFSPAFDFLWFQIISMTF